MIKDSIVNLKKSLRMTLQNVPAVVDTLIRGLDEVEDAADEQSTYTDTERVVGEWIDGSTLYEKIVTITSFPAAGQSTFVNHNISDISEIVYLDCTCFTGSVYQKIPNVWEGSIMNIAANTTGIAIQATRDTSGYNKAYCTIRYTKSAASRSPENDTKNGGEDPDVKLP